MEKINILIVDDQALFAESLKIVLEIRSDFINVVAMATNGLEAIELAEKHEPDLILMDIRMPKMDGVESTKRIHLKFPDIKIIMLTTFDDDEYIRDALNFGATGFLLKDTPPLELISSIHGASNGMVLISPSVAKHLTQNIPMAKNNIKPGWFKSLSRREKQVLKLIVNGLDNREIAEELFIAEQTVKNHVSLIYSKIDTHDRREVIKIASEYI
ncbi:MAG: response regulator transcription factor [Spirochaetaceae bacterium]